MRHPLLAGGRVHPGDRRSRRTCGAGNVKGMLTRPTRRPARQRRSPERGCPPVAPVDHAQVVPAVVALDEVPDPVPPRVDARDHRGPRVRRQRVVERRTAPCPPRKCGRCWAGRWLRPPGSITSKVAASRPITVSFGETNGGEVYERAARRDAALSCSCSACSPTSSAPRRARDVAAARADGQVLVGVSKRSQADRVYDEGGRGRHRARGTCSGPRHREPEPAVRGSVPADGRRGVRSLMAKLDADHSEFTFVDYGLGKGRVAPARCRLPVQAHRRGRVLRVARSDCEAEPGRSSVRTPHG